MGINKYLNKWLFEIILIILLITTICLCVHQIREDKAYWRQVDREMCWNLNVIEWRINYKHYIEFIKSEDDLTKYLNNRLTLEIK